LTNKDVYLEHKSDKPTSDMGDAPATSAKDDEGTTIGFFSADIF
jgi:hypothetical protein